MLEKNNYKIESIFATPLYFSEIEKLNEIEKNFIEEQKNHTCINGGNRLSLNNYILENKCLSNVKNNLMKVIDNYFLKIIDTTDLIEPYITQSWLNFTKKNEYHHEHYHTNSYLSGVLYISEDPIIHSITFTDSRYHPFSFSKVRSFNPFNTQKITYNVGTGGVVLFPSYLRHSVDTNISNYERISLAFNVFLKGFIGSEKDLTKINF